MKKIINKGLLAIVGLGLLLTSCKKDYLETSPTNAVSQDDIFKTTTNAWNAINGIHRSLYVQYNGRQDQGGQSKNMIDVDFMGDDLVSPTTSNGWFISTYRWLDHRNENGWTPFFNYDFYYGIITNANMIISNIDGAAGPDVDKKVIKGQALAYRAWSYFQMVQLFGKRFDKATANDGPGVPLVLAPTIDKLPRASVAAVYAQVLSDLAGAISNLTGAPARANASHLNLNVAKGLRARVALAMQDWTTAATLAAEARQGFTLMTQAQYLQGFNNYTNPEWMWGSHQQADQTTFFYSFFAFMSADYNSTNIRTGPKCINSTLYNGIATTDVRRQLWDPTGTNTTFPIPPGGSRFPYMNRKFLSAGGSGSSIGDVPIMRVAEMYLIEAEARARAGGEDASASSALFTLVKARNPSYVQSSNTGQALINEIMFHRRVELWGEGFRFYDLKRLNLPLDRTGANHVPAVAAVLSVAAGDKTWEVLIPRTELNTNPNVVQNPL
ncbi:MAG: RagB/SusD family nutrient uptake outer membrane protein [Chitinophagaceae bacterium]|nr:RagB/SusD family nutrient uptake outer membrane protein [Chitinophagaceae bacterium]